MSVVGAFYYLRVVKLMYFDEPTSAGPVEARMAVRVLLSLNGLAILVLGLYPGALLRLCENVVP
jgi:NADH-quinone oxidoreductase subunit N